MKNMIIFLVYQSLNIKLVQKVFVRFKKNDQKMEDYL